jgi:hypothetical protein
MTDDELKRKITDMLRDDRQTSTRFREAVGKLRALAQALEASLVPNVVEVRLEPGHRVNYKQMYSFVVRIPKVGIRDVLFRAYVPADGFPVALELSDDEHPRCSTLEDLEATILRFLALPEVRMHLLEVRDLAA